MNRPTIPIRIKILVALLVMLMIAVGMITASMANLFHQDKDTYIKDLTSVIANNARAETEALLEGYISSLQLFADVLFSDQLMPNQKRSLVADLFRRYPDLLSVTAYGYTDKPITIYDENILAETGLGRDDVLAFTERDHTRAMPGTNNMSSRVQTTALGSGIRVLWLASTYTDSPADQQWTLGATIRPGRLFRLTQQSHAFRLGLIDDQRRLIEAPAGFDNLDWLATLPDQQFVAGSMNSVFDFTHGGGDFIGGIATTRGGEITVHAFIARSAAFLSAQRLLRRLFVVGFSLILAVSISGILVSRRLTRPLERLMAATREVGKGRFDITLDSRSRDEIGSLSRSFTDMTTELQLRETALQQAQAALVQSEKMAAFGQLGAGIAHEVKNPLAGILGYAQLGLRKLTQEDPLRRNLEIIEKETRRCTDIISNLMRFARQEKTELVPIDVNLPLRAALNIVDHQLTLNNVTPNLEICPDLPMVMGNDNQLQQVFINLAINALQAFEGAPGRLDLRSLQDDEYVIVEIEDNGPGIPEQIRAKIFEPFFTTKEAGQGTGLGLAVTYGIIKDHGGDIEIISQVGKGTRFQIRFPKRYEKE